MAVAAVGGTDLARHRAVAEELMIDRFWLDISDRVN